jgi:hypothetical protein
MEDALIWLTGDKASKLWSAFYNHLLLAQWELARAVLLQLKKQGHGDLVEKQIRSFLTQGFPQHRYFSL